MPSYTILNLEEQQLLEARYAVRLGDDALMKMAGARLADFIAEQTQYKDINFLVGPGNNGGDALVAASLLKAKPGLNVRVIMPVPAKSELCQRQLKVWEDLGGEVYTDPYDAPKASCVVDGLLGTGAHGPIQDSLREAIQWFNEREAFKIAVDVPSGLNSQTGQWVDGLPGCKVDATLTFICHKAGLYMNEGVDNAGLVLLEELDVSVPLSHFKVIDASDYEHITQVRPNYSHKGTFGRLGIIAGSKGHIGAGLLCARAGLLMGAGTVTLELDPNIVFPVDQQYPEIMINELGDVASYDALVFGPGFGTGAYAHNRLLKLLDIERPLVIDADGLTLISQSKELLTKLLHREMTTVITPHEGEAARLLGVSADQIRQDRLQAARDIALKTGAITVLKGPGTVVAMRSARAWLCPFASQALATGGSGDVLAGMIGAFLAQGYVSTEAILAAVFLHGATGLYQDGPMVAGEIAPRAREILSKARKASKTAHLKNS